MRTTTSVYNAHQGHTVTRKTILRVKIVHRTRSSLLQAVMSVYSVEQIPNLTLVKAHVHARVDFLNKHRTDGVFCIKTSPNTS